MRIRTGRKSFSITIAAAATAVALSLPALAAQPEGWKVRTSHQPLLAKQGIYAFTVEVRDAAGAPVEGARVHLRVPSFRAKEYRLVPAEHIGKGRYWAKAHLVYRDGAAYVRVLVEPGTRSR